ncbi:aminopeptidase [Rhizocola hellebori]|uniref:Aminopeptidase n=1 Tax=Rhizocola hellebori TaxID=1392758 RepID=A0A8J3Q5A8_9ACTN|nr:DUF805 domain-containing protein [Rhizocola hellebori]GIH04263.1 aminopeptidase [Rhizocola hellebori]
MSWYLNVLKSYAKFSGRARRKEFWMFALIHVVIAVALIVVANAAEIDALMYVYFIYLLATIIPTLAVTVRRLHDGGKSGWWYLITFVPFIGSFWLLGLVLQAGQPQANAYGPDPKAAIA